MKDYKYDHFYLYTIAVLVVRKGQLVDRILSIWLHIGDNVLLYSIMAYCIEYYLLAVGHIPAIHIRQANTVNNTSLTISRSPAAASPPPPVFIMAISRFRSCMSRSLHRRKHTNTWKECSLLKRQTNTWTSGTLSVGGHCAPDRGSPSVSVIGQICHVAQVIAIGVNTKEGQLFKLMVLTPLTWAVTLWHISLFSYCLVCQDWLDN